MPDRDWPPAPRRVGRVALALAYLCAAATGGAVLVQPPEWTDTGAAFTILTLSALALLGGMVAAASVVLHNWHIEFVAVWFVAAALAGYAVFVWASVPAGGSLPGAALLTVAPLICVSRGAALWAFSLEANQARGQRVALWRRTASKEFHG